MSYDALVVGSGISGMTTAIVLAIEGRRVLVLEHKAQPGGLMRTFSRNGHVFPTGVHCVGSLAQGQILWRYFKFLRVLDRLALAPMDPDAMMEFRFPGLTFRMPCGHDAFRARLLARFPDESAAVHQFLNDMRHTVARFPLYNLTCGADRPPAGMLNEPLQSYLDRLTENHRLKAVLSALNPFYGIPPQEAPPYVHFLVLDSLLNSAWRIAETRGGLVRAFTDAFQDQGGEIRCSAKVVKIECDDQEASGVVLDNGERIETNTVVYTGHPKNIPALCSRKAFRPGFRRRLHELEETCGVFGAAIVWNHPHCPLARRDTFLYQQMNTHAQYHQTLLAPREQPHALFCSSTPHARNRSHSVMALCFTPCDEWNAWADACGDRRSAEYLEIKRVLAERTLAVVRSAWPEFARHMSVVETFTPLTYRDYSLTPTGSAYGIKKSVQATPSASLTASTRVKGLYLAGQNIVLPGVMGAVISAILACTCIIGPGLLDRIAKETE